MADAIVVLNAGSSSLKFSVFVARGGGLEPDLRGNIEEIDTAPLPREGLRRPRSAREVVGRGGPARPRGGARSPAGVPLRGVGRRSPGGGRAPVRARRSDLHQAAAARPLRAGRARAARPAGAAAPAARPGPHPAAPPRCPLRARASPRSERVDRPFDVLDYVSVQTDSKAGPPIGRPG